MRRSRLAAARAGHVRKRGQPCGRQRNVGSPRGPHLMVSTSMVYGCIIDVFNTENISAECSGEKPPSHPRIPCVYGLEVGVGGGRGCWGYMSRLLFRALRERRTTLAWTENVVVALTCPGRISGAFPPPQITLGILARKSTGATLAIAVSGRGAIPHWR